MTKHMSLERFEELELAGKDIVCPLCQEKFSLTLEMTVGGGYGVVGIKCSYCKRQFGISAGGK